MSGSERGVQGERFYLGYCRFFRRSLCGSAISVVFLSGCAWNGNHGGYVQFYQGKPLPAAQVGMIKGHNNYRKGSIANDMIRIIAIDEKEVPSQFGVAEGADAVSVMPGLHSIKILYVSGYSEVDFYSYRTVQIDVKPGCGYELTAHMTMPTQMVGFDVLPAPLTLTNSPDCRIEDAPPAAQGSWKS